MNESSRSSSEMINRLFSQFGIPFVKDRTGCSLAACGTAVCQQALSRRRLSSRRVMERATAGRSRVDRKRRFRLGGASAGSSEVACAVCEDEASGWHYGAVTCDSCKSFFERSVKDRHIYDCHFNRDCDLRLQRRNHCQGCRWDRCLDAGMIVSAVCKIRALGNDIETDAHPHLRHRHWTRLEAEDMLRMADQSSNLAVTPRPSLPSPTDTENSQYDEFWEDEAGNWTALNDSQPRQESMPISVELVRNALIPLDAPETLAARLTDLERSCLATLFRWNKRRLEHRSDNSNGNFGAAAANWAPILLASAARQFLASCLILPTESGKLLTVALVDRLKWLLRGREFEFEPLLDQFENLAKQIGEMCNQLLSTIQEAKRDVIRDIILLMGEHTENGKLNVCF
ncbi:hypothetical protein BOX15_Mlig007421g1 [Macrostomum lignano]|uniref:Nuclear receptor domain-containing protein n=1 Tax=Macrostomum lignano TaxID=282301 RepID=A0A267DAR8_9PLAT|nr:hypothetical protein BOX15_Mlig007421g1 [Macrostomum lignano]